jgi:hypothetical protein
MNMVKVRVYFKNPIDKKSETILMTENQLTWYRKNKVSSPFKKIIRL